jgi:hypothetical protein
MLQAFIIANHPSFFSLPKVSLSLASSKSIFDLLYSYGANKLFIDQLARSAPLKPVFPWQSFQHHIIRQGSLASELRFHLPLRSEGQPHPAIKTTWT